MSAQPMACMKPATVSSGVVTRSKFVVTRSARLGLSAGGGAPSAGAGPVTQLKKLFSCVSSLTAHVTTVSTILRLGFLA